MAYPAQINTYMNNHYDGMSPEQLILMLFKGAMDRLKLVRQGIEENDIKKRGKNLSKVIAIVSELNASLNSNMNDESTRFLRGLYTAILTELPMVSVNNDLEILTRTERYLGKLTQIWEEDVMGKHTRQAPEADKTQAPKPVPANGYPGNQTVSRLGSISV